MSDGGAVVLPGSMLAGTEPSEFGEAVRLGGLSVTGRMRKLRFTEKRIIGVLREQEAGAKMTDVCRKHRISPATFFNER